MSLEKGPPRILALDPGATTGWAMADSVIVYGASIVAAGQVPREGMWDLLSNTRPHIIVYERFDYRPSRIHVDLTAVEVIGVIKEWVRQKQTEALAPRLIPQGPDAKFPFNNKELRELDAYQTAMPHANDAIRHLFYYLEFGRKKGGQK